MVADYQVASGHLVFIFFHRFHWLIGGLLCLSLLPFHWAQAQYFSRSGGPIADNGQFIEFSLGVSGLPERIDTNFGVSRVCLSIQHGYVSQLQVQLVSPGGVTVNLFHDIGWDGSNFTNTCFEGYDNRLVFNGSAPFTGNFRPMQSLASFNNGQSPNGTWKIRIRDNSTPHAGSLVYWAITFSDAPVRLFPFSSSNLPIAIVDTRNEIIVDEPKIAARFKLIHQSSLGRIKLADTSQYEWIRCGIEQRGSSSAGFPKKSFGVEIQDKTGEDSSVALLDMPPQSDWVLSANFSDKSLLRNAFAYQLSASLGWYAPRTRYVELVLNGEYQGVYLLTEKIKRDANRVDIARLRPTDVSGADVTGGYIIKIDKPTGNDAEGFNSRYPGFNGSVSRPIRFLYDYPNADVLAQPQRDYIKSFVDSFETVLFSERFDTPNSYKKYVNLPSFIDFFIVNEWSKNIDGFRFSTYLTKPKVNRNRGRLIMGPVWDFDLAWRNADYCRAELVPGWTYLVEEVCPSGLTPAWWNKFRTDSEFETALRCRWKQVAEEIWPPSRRAQWIDSVSQLLQEAQVRNFTYWPILGEYVWPNPLPLPTTYAAEVAGFDNWLNQRANWMTSQLASECVNSNNPLKDKVAIKVFPNPANDRVWLEGLPNEQSVNILLIDTFGKKIRLQIDAQHGIDISAYPKGLYHLFVPGCSGLSFHKQQL